MGNLSASHIAIILVLGLLLFGSRLPQVGRSLGKALSEFKRGLKGLEDDFEKVQRDADREIDEEERKKRQAAEQAAAPALPSQPLAAPAVVPAGMPAAGAAHEAPLAGQPPAAPATPPEYGG